MSENAPHHLGESGVTRLFWRVWEPADLDSAEEVLTGHGVLYTRHRDEGADGISFRDPDGLSVILIRTDTVKGDKPPPPWLYWYH